MNTNSYKAIIKSKAIKLAEIKTSAINDFSAEKGSNRVIINITNPPTDEKAKAVWDKNIENIKKELQRKNIDIKKNPIFIVVNMKNSNGLVDLKGLDSSGSVQDISANSIFLSRKDVKTKEEEEKDDEDEFEQKQKQREIAMKEAEELGITYKEYLSLKSTGEFNLFKAKKKYGLNLEQYKEAVKNAKQEGIGLFEYLEKEKSENKSMEDLGDTLKKFDIPEEDFKDLDKAFEDRFKINDLYKKLEKLGRKIPQVLESIYKKINNFDTMFEHKLTQKGIDIKNIDNEKVAREHGKYITEQYNRFKKGGLKPSEEMEKIFDSMNNPERTANVGNMFKEQGIPLAALENSKDALKTDEQGRYVYYNKIIGIYEQIRKEDPKSITPLFQTYIKNLREEKQISDKAAEKTPINNAHKVLGTKPGMKLPDVQKRFKEMMTPIIGNVPAGQPVNFDELKKNNNQARQIIDAFEAITQKRVNDAIFKKL